MKRGYLNLGVVGIILALSVLTALPFISRVSAQQKVEIPSLSITRFKISTGSQFIELHNQGSEAIDMSRIQLAYYNNYELSKSTSSKLVSLSGSLQPQSYYLVNDSAVTLCYQTTVASASLSFSTTSGMVQLLFMNQPVAGGQFVSHVLDNIAWSKSAASTSGIETLPAGSDSFLQNTKDGWTEVWPSQDNACEYETPPGVFIEEDYDDYIFLGSSLPPVRYVAAVSTKSGLANRNVGKMAPVINEMLPNPASPQTDVNDEFIELYNPNDSNFDLTGFKLAFGSTKPKKYTFPEGTVLKPKEFKAFTSADTSISLSNTQAQVWLLDPNEKVIGQSEPYSKAKDGQAWVMDSGKWTWTGIATPDEMNAISPIGNPGGTAKTAAAVLGINNTNATGSSGAAAGSGADSLADKTPLHPFVLVVVGLGAVAYTLYEYRQDMSNKLFQFRRYLRSRRTLRQKVPGR